MSIDECKLNNWVPFPRKISSDFRNGIITLSEMQVYNWLRLNANLYGITITSLSDISTDIFKNEKSINSINKILLALKKKKWLYFKRRTGSRGSFEIRFGDFILPTKQINSLEKYFIDENGRASGTTHCTNQADPEQSSTTQKQNFEELNTQIKSIVSGFSIKQENRTRNIDNDNNNNNKTSISFKKRTTLSKFKPKNLDEQLCLNIAINLKEKDINFLLSILNKYGRVLIDRAWRTFNEHEQKTEILNRGAYFNTLISGIISNKNNY